MTPPLNAKTTLLQALGAGDGYGLELIDRVRLWTGGRFVLHQGSIYPALRSLERAGLVRSYTRGSVSDHGGRPRVYYSLTPPGHRLARHHSEIVASLFGQREALSDIESIASLQRSA